MHGRARLLREPTLPGAPHVSGRRPCRRFRGALLAALLACTTAACASTTRIGDLLGDPQRYNGEQVTVKGEVTNAAGFLGSGAFRIDDGTGSIFVISQGQGVPAEGSTAKVKGRFESLFNLAGRSVAAIVQGPEQR